MRILLVDDEPLELFLSKRFLSAEFQVEGFNTIPDAIQWAKVNSFEVLVSDYYLGKNLHAHDLLKELIALKGNSFKSFVLTNYIDDGQKDELMKAGFNGIIEKPLSLEKFKSVVVS